MMKLAKVLQNALTNPVDSRILKAVKFHEQNKVAGKTVAQRVGGGGIPMYTLSGEWVCEKRGERADAPVPDAASPALSGERYIR